MSINAFVKLWGIGVTSTFDALAAFIGRPVTEQDVEPLTWHFYEAGKSVSASEYIEAWNSLYGVGRMIAQFFEHYDVLLTPTLAKAPVAIGEIDTHHPSPETNFLSLIDYANYTPIFNATGQPSLSLPLCESKEGLPIGMMLTGRYGEEETLISLGSQLERAHPWRGKHPQIWD